MLDSPEFDLFAYRVMWIWGVYTIFAFVPALAAGLFGNFKIGGWFDYTLRAIVFGWLVFPAVVISCAIFAFFYDTARYLW